MDAISTKTQLLHRIALAQQELNGAKERLRQAKSAYQAFRQANRKGEQTRISGPLMARVEACLTDRRKTIHRIRREIGGDKSYNSVRVALAKLVEDGRARRLGRPREHSTYLAMERVR